MTTIKVRQNGPYLVDGDDVKLIDWNGNEYTIAKRPYRAARTDRHNRNWRIGKSAIW